MAPPSRASTETPHRIEHGFHSREIRRESSILPQGKRRLPEAAERVVKLDQTWGKPEKAAEWREKIKAQPPSTRKPR
jgi:hypothetical protein